MFEKIKEDVHYSIKAIRSILSGFDSLETKDPCGGFYEVFPGDEEEPYYVCARFNNGRHLPLPLVLEPADSEYKLQKVVLYALGWTKPMRQAKKACVEYENEFLDGYGIELTYS